MKRRRTVFEPVDLDAMDYDELKDFAQNRENPVGLRVYAGHKANAIFWRLHGDTTMAMRYEARCDETYRLHIPKSLRW